MRHFLLFACFIVSSFWGIAQDGADQPMTEKVYVQDANTGTWNLSRSSRYAYLPSGEQVLDDRLVFSQDQVATPSRIETRYDEAGRELANWFLYFDEERQLLDTAYYRTSVYDERGNLILSSIYEQLDSANLVLLRQDRLSYGSQGCVTQVVRSSLMQDFRESRELSVYQIVAYQRDAQCQILQQTEIAPQQSGATYRTEFVRDDEGRLLGSLVYFLNSQRPQEDLVSMEVREYDAQGRLSFKEVTQYPVFRADTLIRRSIFTYEGDVLDPITEVTELYSSNNATWRKVSEMINLVDPRGIVRPEYRFAVYDFDPNLTQAIDNYTYQFSPDGYLVQRKSTQEVDRDGEVINRNTIQERYSLDCEGKVMEKLSLRELYRVPSFGGDPFTEIFSERAEYTYLPNTACTGLNPNYSIKAYPNPTRGEVWIESELFGLPGSEVEILSLDGRVLQHAEGLLTEAMIFRLEDLPGGMYQVRVRNEAQDLSFSTKVALVRP